MKLTKSLVERGLDVAFYKWCQIETSLSLVRMSFNNCCCVAVFSYVCNARNEYDYTTDHKVVGAAA